MTTKLNMGKYITGESAKQARDEFAKKQAQEQPRISKGSMNVLTNDGSKETLYFCVVDTGDDKFLSIF